MKIAPAELELIHRQCFADLASDRLDALAERLTVSAASLKSLGIGWHTKLRAFTFPMRDAQGRIVGIRTRYADGSKRCLKGSRLGIAIPNDPHIIDPEWLLVTEGESDAAAAIDLGFFAVSRPGCSNCENVVADYITARNPMRVAIVADADEPGQIGAKKLARLVAGKGRRVRIITVPDGCKDLREWKAAHGSCDDLSALLDAPANRRVA